MEKAYISEKIFEKIDYQNNPLAKGEYENCHFRNCDFSNRDLSTYRFIDCEFLECNLSLAKLEKAAFLNILFKDSKMLGFDFDDCSKFGLSFRFENCILNHSTFYKLKIKNTVFKNVQLHETDFTESDLTSSVFENCDLSGAAFDYTILEKADFRTSFNYSIDPARNRMRKAKFSTDGISGLLNEYDIVIEITD
ncbi:MAG: pentapeptide repeat-containing protein [Paludibacteraceae bacterium]